MEEQTVFQDWGRLLVRKKTLFFFQEGTVKNGLMVSALDSGASAVRFRALAWDIVSLCRTLNSHGASLHPGI